MTFRHVEERSEFYRGPDRTLTTNYSAELNECWLTVTIERPDAAFCQVHEGRFRIVIIENNLRYTDEIEIRRHRGVDILRFAVRWGRSRDLGLEEIASRETYHTCGSERFSSESEVYLNNVVFPPEKIESVALRLIAHRNRICPNQRDWFSFFRY